MPSSMAPMPAPPTHAATPLSLTCCPLTRDAAARSRSLGAPGVYQPRHGAHCGRRGAAVNSAYAPIVATTWDGSGVYQAVGGTWDSVNHVFAVSAAVAASGAGGAADSLNTSSNQRMLITDTAAHTSVGVSFLSTEGTVTLTGTTVTGAALSSLEGLLPAGQAPLDAWGFSSVTGYTAGDPVYLSLSLGAGYSPYQLATAGFTRTNLTVWDYNRDLLEPDAGERFDLRRHVRQLHAALNGTALNGTALNGYDYAVVGTPLLLGDANRDGRVDINDLTIVLANYNQTRHDLGPGRVHRQRHGGHQRPDDRAGELQHERRIVRRRHRAPCRSRVRSCCWPRAWSALLACAWRKRK